MMDTSKAFQRLKLAQQAMTKLDECKTYADFQDAWLEFLLHANGVYAQLEQASKKTPQWRQWFGAKKRERKSDELLQYVHQARHSDEHTLEQVTEIDNGEIFIGGPGEESSKNFRILGSTDSVMRIESLDGNPVPVRITRPKAILRSVTGRGNTIFNPPRYHKGNKLPDNSPKEVAKYTICYIHELLREASMLT